ncbi:hypothetical protein HBI47_040230 [Parastagonospora nodorum]|nr:hypothetical protein HBI47_040230 [Parastagonospora nodorum]KAH6549814.1 hypothetical protein HBI07_055780 [Parastagonospora nodorum]
METTRFRELKTKQCRAKEMTQLPMNPEWPLQVLPPSFEHEVRFRGTPHRGWYDLDPRYRVRTAAEAHSFFVKGRVFAMLWSETAGATANLARNGTENTAITVGLFNQQVFSQIRRFVIMEVNREKHFVYACAIFTYNGQGTLKRGCTASEHAPVYMTGSQATTYQGELERGMTKEPIEVTPDDETETMLPASRLRFGKHYSIEWNVKVREIGIVAPRYRSRLMKHYRDEQRNGFDDDDDEDFSEEEDDESGTVFSTYTPAAATGVSYTQTGYANVPQYRY